MSEKMKKCKYCASDIPAKAKICPNCRKKLKTSGLVKFFVGFLLFLGIVANLASKDSTNNKPTKSEVVDNLSIVKVEEPSESESMQEEISYTAISVEQLNKELKDNALKAKETYNGTYLEVTGMLDNIDASGKYISLADNSGFDLLGVQCFIKDDGQKQKVMDMSTGNKYTIKVKITNVGEIIGYQADIIEFE